MNNQRWVNVAFGGLAAVGGLLLRQIADAVWGILRMPIPQDLPLMPADLIGLIAAIAVFIILRRHNRANEFSNGVLLELSKVTWPQKKETLLSTAVISIMVAICALLLFGFDTLWGTIVKLLYQ